MENALFSFGGITEATVTTLLQHQCRCALMQTAVSLKVPPAVPPAIQISDAFGKRRPLGRCGGGSIESDTCELQRLGWLWVGRAMSIVVYCIIIDGDGDWSVWWMRSKAAVTVSYTHLTLPTIYSV